mmetsp:Transcript_2840/g.8475  ORF Transcript_2840/g.8475 Transcript_2840/m.8475 type:complete len:103 (+) Transcript_2840:1232-1540(+)
MKPRYAVREGEAGQSGQGAGTDALGPVPGPENGLLGGSQTSTVQSSSAASAPRTMHSTPSLPITFTMPVQVPTASSFDWGSYANESTSDGNPKWLRTLMKTS